MNDNADDNVASPDDGEEDARKPGYSLGASLQADKHKLVKPPKTRITTSNLVDKALNNDDKCGKNGMHTKDNVIQFNWILTTWMLLKEFLFNFGNKLECNIERRVGEESRYIEGDIVKVKSHNGATLKVLPNLWPKGDTPSGKVDPADNTAYGENDLGSTYVDGYVGMRCTKWRGKGIKILLPNLRNLTYSMIRVSLSRTCATSVFFPGVVELAATVRLSVVSLP